MFENPTIKVALPLVLLKKACLVLLSAYLLIGLTAAYRAYYQVHSLEVRSDDSILRGGSMITTRAVSYARTTVDVKLELIQGDHATTLATLQVPGNDWVFIDPRIQRGSQTAAVTDDILNQFEPGPAKLRATAIGRPQWTRLPPPVIKELRVEIRND